MVTGGTATRTRETKTEIRFVIQGKVLPPWAPDHPEWEDLFEVETWPEARECLRLYNENDGFMNHRVIRRRYWRGTDVPYRGPASAPVEGAACKP